jgi:hypothetical protein
VSTVARSYTGVVETVRRPDRTAVTNAVATSHWNLRPPTRFDSASDSGPSGPSTSSTTPSGPIASPPNAPQASPVTTPRVPSDLMVPNYPTRQAFLDMMYPSVPSSNTYFINGVSTSSPHASKSLLAGHHSFLLRQFSRVPRLEPDCLRDRLMGPSQPCRALHDRLSVTLTPQVRFQDGRSPPAYPPFVRRIQFTLRTHDTTVTRV